jgi:hypothetical protein
MRTTSVWFARCLFFPAADQVLSMPSHTVRVEGGNWETQLVGKMNLVTKYIYEHVLMRVQP